MNVNVKKHKEVVSRSISSISLFVSMQIILYSALNVKVVRPEVGTSTYIHTNVVVKRDAVQSLLCVG